MRRSRLAQALVAALGVAMLSGTATARDANAESLLAIDQDRGAFINRIVDRFGPQLEQSDAGVTRAQLRDMLQKLRADHLMAASMAGTVSGLRDVIANSLASSAPVNAAMAQMSGTAKALSGGDLKKIADVGPNALGSATSDLVYTPVTPCRLFDTRTGQGGAGTPSLGIARTVGAITPVVNQGGPGGCSAPAGTAVALIAIGTLTPTGNGILQGGPQGTSSFTNALVLYQPGDQYGTTVAMPLNAANGQFDLVELFAQADLYGDLLGYFKAPSGGYVSSVGAGTGISITGSAAAPVVNVASSYQSFTITRFSGPIGTIAGGATTTFSFIGGTSTLTLATAQKLSGVSSVGLGTTAGVANVDVALCYQPSGGAIASIPVYMTFEADTTRVANGIAGSTTGTIAAGTYTVGVCARNNGAQALDSNDYTSGWIMSHL